MRRRIISFVALVALVAVAASAERKLLGSSGFNIKIGPNGCSQKALGKVKVNGYVSSPWLLTPFELPFKNPATPSPHGPPVVHEENSAYTMEYYDIKVEEVQADMKIAQCNGKNTPMLMYGGQFPGPLIQAKQGVQMLIRFTNLIPPTSADFPATEKSWGPGHVPKNVCAERHELNGNSNHGTGRAISVHHHGMPSLAPFDGWAEDIACYGETKSYVLSHDFAGTFWYHDHALGTTSENTYSGLEGMHIVHPCKERYGMAGMPMHVLQLNDAVFDDECKLLNDRVDMHHDNIFGDINMVNGVRWPVFTTQPRWTRFKTLTASPSRAFILKIVDSTGYNVAQDICWIVGSDGGYLTSPRKFPAKGLLSGTAYRWDIVCDFSHSKAAGKVLYLYNQQDSSIMTSEIPFFCYSHLLMKINVNDKAGAPPAGVSPGFPLSTPINGDAYMGPDVSQWAKFNAADNPPSGDSAGDALGAGLQAAMTRAKAGSVDRTIKFEHSGDTWVMNGVGWDTNLPASATDSRTKHLIFDNVGQNTVEIWQLESGGGWIHPVHLHLIEFYVLRINGAAPPPELALVPKDVIQIGGNVRKLIVAARYGPNFGKYMFHCHNGVHEDRDMLRAFLIKDATSGKTALTMMSDMAMFKDQGEKYVDGDGRDSGEYPTADPRDLAEVAAEYLKKDPYFVFYPVKSKLPSDADWGKIMDRAFNPWRVEMCGA